MPNFRLLHRGAASLGATAIAILLTANPAAASGTQARHAPRPTTDAGTTTAYRYWAYIGGVASPVASITGCTLQQQLVPAPGTPDGFTPGPTTIQPCVVEFSTTASKFLDWVATEASGAGATVAQMAFVMTDPALHMVKFAVVVTDPILIGLSLPALGASSKSPVRLTATITGGALRWPKVGTVPGPSGAPTPTAQRGSDFRVSLDGGSQTHVTAVSPITLTRQPLDSKTPGPWIGAPFAVTTLWQFTDQLGAWYTRSIVKGLDNGAHALQVTLLDPTLQVVRLIVVANAGIEGTDSGFSPPRRTWYLLATSVSLSRPAALAPALDAGIALSRTVARAV